MNTNELQQIVIVEAISLLLICTVILAAFKRWKLTLIVATTMATVAFFSAWSSIMALGALSVYGPGSLLLWTQLHKNKKDPKQVSRLNNFLQKLYWFLVSSGVLILILNNTRNIFIYLG